MTRPGTTHPAFAIFAEGVPLARLMPDPAP